MHIEEASEKLLEKLPSFSDACKTFLGEAESITTARVNNSLTVKHYSQLIEILEIPHLMDMCVRNAFHEEALQLLAHVTRLQKKYGDVAVINSIAADVDHCSRQMLSGLLQQLQQDVQLPACLRIIGYLRRLEAFGELPLRVQFLQARDAWLQKVLDTIPTADAYTYITKVVEASRVHLFDIITQYKAVFSHVTDASAADASSSLLTGWVMQRVSKFLRALDEHLPRLTDRINSVLSQCMHFALSLGRVGLDFRSLLPPLFERTVIQLFVSQMNGAVAALDLTLQSFVLASYPSIGNFGGGDAFELSETPIVPLSLMTHPPLAAFTNDLLVAFNDLRECAPVAIADDVGATLHGSLAKAGALLRKYYDVQGHSFDSREAAVFQKMALMFSETLVPCMAKCLDAIYPSSLFQVKATLAPASGGGGGGGSDGNAVGAGAPLRLVDVEGISKPLARISPEIQALFAPKLKRPEAAAAAAAAPETTAAVPPADGDAAEERAAAWATRVFGAADKNGDGTLTKSEVKNYFRANAADKEALVGKDFHWSTFWGEMDEDGDGTFDIAEFTAMAVKVARVHADGEIAAAPAAPAGVKDA